MTLFIQLKLRNFNLILLLSVLFFISLQIFVAQSSQDSSPLQLQEKIRVSHQDRDYFRFFTLSIDEGQAPNNGGDEELRLGIDGSQAESVELKYLVLRIMPVDDSSDPDVYVSKVNKFPQQKSEGEICFSEKQGEQLCILAYETDQSTKSDILLVENQKLKASNDSSQQYYISVRCMQQCEYEISSQYVETYRLQQLKAQGLQTYSEYLEIDDSVVLKAYIPKNTNDGQTQSMTISLSILDVATQTGSIRMRLSQTADLKMMPDSDNSDFVIENGKAVRLTVDSLGWCTDCWIYIMVEVEQSGQYFITQEISARTDILGLNYQTKVLKNQELECFSYYVLQRSNDVIFKMTFFQGQADIFIASLDSLTYEQLYSPIIMRQRHYYQTTLIYSNNDRTRRDQETGPIKLCVIPSRDTSFKIQALQGQFMETYIIEEDNLLTFTSEASQYTTFVFASDKLAENQRIQVYLNWDSQKLDTRLRLLYKICESSHVEDCSLNDELEGMGLNSQMTLISSNLTLKQLTSVINHNSARDCLNPSQGCHYIFSIFNPSLEGPLVTNFRINILSLTKTIIDQFNEDGKFQNKGMLDYGQRDYYQIDTRILQNDTVKIVIDLISDNGQAFLYASTTKSYLTEALYDYKSERVYKYNQLEITSWNNSKNISIGVFSALSSSFYTLNVTKFTRQDITTASQMLAPQSVIEIIDGNQTTFRLNSSAKFLIFSLTPITQSYENRLVVISASVLSLTIDTPTYQLIAFQLNGQQWYVNVDKKTITFNTSDPEYNQSLPIYINVSSSYQFMPNSDFITLTLTAFSQIYDFRVVQDIQVLDTFMGYSINSQPVSYRHYVLDLSGTFNARIKSVFGKPVIMTKISHSSQSDLYDTSDRDTSNSIDQEFGEYNVLISSYARTSKNQLCKTSIYSMNGGNTSCVLYIAVQCQSECIFSLSLSILELPNRQMADFPRYLIPGQYYNGRVQNGTFKYFYYPFMKYSENETAIVLHKRNNTDSFILARFFRKANLTYLNWWFPSNKSYDLISRNNYSNIPEIIDFNSSALSDRCKIGEHCVLILGIQGNNWGRESSFELGIFTNQNRIAQGVSERGILSQGNYNYYWFTMNYTIPYLNSDKIRVQNKVFNYFFAAGADETLADVNIYLTAQSDRYPSQNIYDAKADGYLADSLVIANNDTFLAQKNLTFGCFFMVAIHAPNSSATHTLMMTGPNYSYPIIQQLSLDQTIKFITNPQEQRQMIYSYYNVAEKLNLTFSSLNATFLVMINYLESYQSAQNIYLAIPLNVSNAKVNYLVAPNTNKRTNIDCYQCQIFITISQVSPLNRTGVYSMILTERQSTIVQSLYSLKLDQPYQAVAYSNDEFKVAFSLSQRLPFEVKINLVDYNSSNLSQISLYSEQDVNQTLCQVNMISNQTIVTQRTQDLVLGPSYILQLIQNQTQTNFSNQLNKLTLKFQLVQDLNYRRLSVDGSVMRDLFWTSRGDTNNYFLELDNTTGNITLTLVSKTQHFYPYFLFKRQDYQTFPIFTSLFSQPSLDNRDTDSTLTVVGLRDIGSFQPGFKYQQKMQYEIQLPISEVYATNIYTLTVGNVEYGFLENQKIEYEITIKAQKKTSSNADSVSKQPKLQQMLQRKLNTNERISSG